jgi:hypothetical protein
MNRSSRMTQQYDFPIWRGAPVPMIVQNAVITQDAQMNDIETLEPFATTLALRVKVRQVPAFVLTVGAGITLQTAEGVANGQAMIHLSEAQSNLIPVGGYATYELTEGVTGSLSLVLAGNLIGEQAE